MMEWNLPSSLPSEGEALEASRKILEEAWRRNVYTEIMIVGLNATIIEGSKEGIEISQGGKWLAGVRVEGSTISYASTLKNLPKAFEDAYSSYKALGRKELYPLAPLVDRVENELEVAPWDVDLEKKVYDVKEAIKEVEGSVSVIYRETYGYKIYINSEGREIVQRLSYNIHAANVTVAEGGNRGNGYFSEGSRRGYTTDPIKVVKEAVRKAKLQLKGKGAEPGSHRVILMPPAIGVMVHEALGHMSEGDHIKGGSPLKLGMRVGPEFLDVSDSPGNGEEWGSIFYDDEGTKPRKVNILREGKVSGFLLDRYYAKELNMEPTGNGRQEDPSKRIIPRMRVTYVEPKDWSLEELMEELKEGILIVDSSGGNAELDGTFFFMSMEAWYVKNGEKAYPLKPLGMMGNVLEMLSKVEAIGKELGFRPGTCGKWGQRVPVSVGGAPTLTTLNISPV